MNYLTTVSLMILLALAGSASGEEASSNSANTKQENTIHEQTRRLLLDARIVDKTRNARLTIGEVKKHSANPLFGEDKPWESRFDNVYANVIYDQQKNKADCHGRSSAMERRERFTRQESAFGIYS